MPKDSKHCPECKAEANDQFNRVFKCIRENISKTPIYLIMAYCGMTRVQAFPYLEKLKTMRYVTGNMREGYSITATGAAIFKEKEQGKTASLEENKALVCRGIETLNKGDLTVLDEFMALNYVDHTNQLRGREDVKQFYMRTLKAFPDFHRTIEDIIAEGDKVWARFKITGTDSTGKKIESTSVNIYRIVGGKVVEGWSVPQLVSKEKKLKIT
jgi:predicted ester cyclase